MDAQLELASSFSKEKNILSLMLLLTGIFAIIGGLYTWGEGFIFNAPTGTDLRIFIADILIAGPFSILASLGLWKCKLWGLLFSWFVSGVYLYGSVAVYVMIFQNGSPYPFELILPPLAGTCLSFVLIFWTKSHIKQFISQNNT